VSLLGVCRRLNSLITLNEQDTKEDQIFGHFESGTIVADSICRSYQKHCIQYNIYKRNNNNQIRLILTCFEKPKNWFLGCILEVDESLFEESQIVEKPMQLFILFSVLVVFKKQKTKSIIWCICNVEMWTWNQREKIFIFRFSSIKWRN